MHQNQRLAFLLDHWNSELICSNCYKGNHQFSSVAQSCPTLCDPMDCSTPGLPVHHQLSEFTQAHVHWAGDAIQPSYPVSPFSSHLQSFPASESFQMNQFFTSGSQSTGVSASASVHLNQVYWQCPKWRADRIAIDKVRNTLKCTD